MITMLFDGGVKPLVAGSGYGSYAIATNTGWEVFRCNFSTMFEHEEDFKKSIITSNTAEYWTLLIAVSDIYSKLVSEDVDLLQVHIDIWGDSALVINQVAGRWKINKPEFVEIRNNILELLSYFKGYSLSWHERANSVRVLGH